MDNAIFIQLFDKHLWACVEYKLCNGEKLASKNDSKIFEY
jgi:hypothetical protein